MPVKARGQVDQVGEDIGRVGEEEQPGAGQTYKMPVPARGVLVLLTRQQRKDQRQPGQEQVPNQEAVTEVARRKDAREHQRHAGAGSKSQREHRHGRLTPKGELE